MSPTPVVVIGAGKRVLETALPAFRRAPEHFELRAVVARTAREETSEGRPQPVRALEDLTPALLDGVGLVYVAVTKDAVPKVLRRLNELDPGARELLIDTPVVRFRNFGAARLVRPFRSAWVAEDCAYLPWFDLVREAAASGLLGAPRAVTFDRSAYAYHALATAKALLGASRVRSGRRRALGGGVHERTLTFDGARRARVLEPRDYAVGHVTIEGAAGRLSDRADEVPAERHLTALADGDGAPVTGFRVGDLTAELDPLERELTAGDPAGARVTARQDAMKRVGFLRLLRALGAGRGGYPVPDGLDDMVVDYHLEKAGRYVANPFTSPRSPLARVLLGLVARG